MRYSTKLYVFFIGISSFVLIVAYSILITSIHDEIFHDIQKNAMAIAATTAAHIDGDLVEQIKTKEDEQKPAYEVLRKFLRKSRNANRNSDIYVKFVYTLYPDPKNPEHFLFGVDAEETAKDFSPAGTQAYGATTDLLSEHLTEHYSFDKLTKDEWGTWLTGYAPIYNSKGIYVGTVGVDVSAAFVYSVMKNLYLIAGISLTAAILAALIAAYFLAQNATRALQALDKAAQKIGKGDFAYRVEIQTKDEFQELGQTLNNMAKDLAEKERMKTGFARYVSKHVMEKIMTETNFSLGGEKRKITVFFCDIRDFTRIAEQMPPEEVMKILNEYFQSILGLVFKNNGTLDKMIGDAVMAEFGVPMDDPNQERNAVLTALEMHQALALLRIKWRLEGKPELDIGIGIHTGEAIVGMLGSIDDRVEFTAIGDTVNIASRLEHATRQYQEKILVSETTFQALNNQFPSKALGPLQLPGREQPINVYAILPLP